MIFTESHDFILLYSGINFLCVFEPCILYSSADRQLGWYHIVPIVKSATINMDV